jgi:hypothetical protein
MKAVVHVQALGGCTVQPPATKPIGGLMDPRFKYVPAAETDIRKTFARILNERHKGKAL